MKPLDLAAGAVLGAATLWVFRQPLVAMAERWDSSPMYSYGYVVPFISAFLLWSRKDEFMRREIRPSRLAGGGIILAALVALAVGRIVGILLLEELSFIVALTGMALFLFGRAWLSLSAPAIAYLLFMVPVWDAFTEPLHWPFQLNSARLGVAMMQSIGVPVYREDTFIALPNLLIEVARECSGVNYLVAVLALAIPMSYLRLRRMWQRVVLIGTALCIAALANSLRVALIGTLAYYEIGSPLHGPFHVLHGLFVSGIGFVVILAGLRMLEEREPDAGPRAEPDAVIGQVPGTRWRVADALGLATVFCTIAFIGVAPQMREVALAQPLDTLPAQIGAWIAMTGADGGQVSNADAAWGSADRKLDRMYRSPQGQSVRVEVYYFAAQRQGHELVSSASEELHRGAVPVVIQHGSQSFAANLVEWPRRNETVMFWYDSEGLTQADHREARLTTIRRSLLTRRNNAAAVVLRTRTGPDARNTLETFSGLLRPALAGMWEGVAAGDDSN